MPQDFKPRQELVIDGTTYRFVPHPTLPSSPLSRKGRESVVYGLTSLARSQDGTLLPVGVALKVFEPRFRVPALVSHAERLAPLATLPGMALCQRKVLSPSQSSAFLRQYPDLVYAILMPWIDGPTWADVVRQEVDRAGRPLSPERCLELAHSLAGVLQCLEEQGLAHCDLCGSHLLLPGLAENPDRRGPLVLVDLEQMHGLALRPPDALPTGSPGYAHRAVGAGYWATNADRFSGAILLAEMLCWWDEGVRAEAQAESYFLPGELQADCRRYDVLRHSLGATWGAAVAGLLERAWHSQTLADCAPFGEWLVSLPDSVQADRMSLVDHEESEAPAQREPAPSEAVDRQAARTATGAWRLPAAGVSRSALLLKLAAISAALAALFFLVSSLFGGTIESATRRLLRGGGWSVALATGACILAALVGCVEVWMFRERIRSHLRLPFVLVTALGGLVGGLLGGLSVQQGWLSWPWIGLLVGGVAGGLSSLGQNYLMSSHGTALKWFAWSLGSWAAIWLAGYAIATVVSGVAGQAAAGALILVITGAALSLLLRFSPDIEF